MISFITAKIRYSIHIYKFKKKKKNTNLQNDNIWILHHQSFSVHSRIQNTGGKLGRDTARQLLHTCILMSKIPNGYEYYREDGTDLT